MVRVEPRPVPGLGRPRCVLGPQRPPQWPARRRVARRIKTFLPCVRSLRLAGRCRLSLPAQRGLLGHRRPARLAFTAPRAPRTPAPRRRLPFLHKGRRADGSPYRVSALYVYGTLVRGLPARAALERLFHAFLAIFRSCSTSGCSALLLRPLGGDAVNAGLLAVLNLTAVRLAAGCLPAEALCILRSGPLGIHVRGATASRAFHSVEHIRRAASRGAAPEGGSGGGGPVPAPNGGVSGGEGLVPNPAAGARGPVPASNGRG